MTEKVVFDVKSGEEKRVKLTAAQEAAHVREVADRQAASAATAYREDRRKAYPSVGDQLDTIIKQMNQDRFGGKALIKEADDLVNSILAVKAAYPKPGV